MDQGKLSAGKAALWVLSSLVVVAALFFGARFSYCYLHTKWIEDDRYKIVACIGKGRTLDTVQPIFLEELMGLSQDEPTALYAFNTKQAAKKILACPAFRKAKVSRLKPGVVVVDYELRRPIAEIADFENRAIDKSRTIFPLAPFIAPKRLPKLYLGSLDSNRVESGVKTMTLFNERLPSQYHLEFLDMSMSCAAGALPEIVARIEGQRRFLVRLSPKRIEEDLSNFVALLPTLESLVQSTDLEIIDLRIAQLALVKAEGSHNAP